MLARSSVLLVVCTACATMPVDAKLPAGLDAWPAVRKLAFFPVQVRVEVDNAPITPESLMKVQQSVQASLERGVGHENLEVRGFFALAEPWQLGALAMSHWLDATPCFGGSAPGEIGLATLLPPLNADAAVYVELHARLTRDGVSSGHTLLGKLAAGLGVVTLANVAALSAASAGSPYLELAVEDATAQLVARDLESRRYGPLCADHVDIGLRDDPTVRVLGTASVTVAVVAANGQLLWFRRGRVPLVSADLARGAHVLATLVRAEP